jgi:hypothetical protein
LQVTHSQSLESEAAIPAESGGQVVGLQYLADQCGACLATSNGNITLWSLDTGEVRLIGDCIFSLVELF